MDVNVKSIALDELKANPRKTLEYAKYENIFEDPLMAVGDIGCTFACKNSGYVANSSNTSFTISGTETFYVFVARNISGDIERFILEFTISSSDVSRGMGYTASLTFGSTIGVSISESADLTVSNGQYDLFSFLKLTNTVNATVSPFVSQNQYSKQARLALIDTLKNDLASTQTDVSSLKSTTSNLQSQINAVKNQLYPVGIVQWIKSGSTPTGIGLPGSWTSLDPVNIVSNSNTSVGLDVTGANFQNGTNVELWAIGTEAQKWRMRSASGTFLVPWLRTA